MEPTGSTPSPRMQKLFPVRIFEQAVEQIQDLISTGALTGGQRLPPEQELSRQLGVSRSSVREALRVLESEGTVEIRRGSGTFIATRPAQGNRRGEMKHFLEVREETLEQVLEVRESIEALAASLVASSASPEALADIRGIVEEQAALLNKWLEADDELDIDALARLDGLFHLAVSSASGNDIVHEIINHLIPAFNESNKAVLYLGKRAKKMEHEHHEILAALESRNAPAAEAAMREHIQQVKKEILEIQPNSQHSANPG
jgi:GntR family transcriptional regulator, transcriptional repressor for pyruvate dehydrogenase complex